MDLTRLSKFTLPKGFDSKGALSAVMMGFGCFGSIWMERDKKGVSCCRIPKIRKNELRERFEKTAPVSVICIQNPPSEGFLLAPTRIILTRSRLIFLRKK